MFLFLSYGSKHVYKIALTEKDKEVNTHTVQKDYCSVKN